MPIIPEPDLAKLLAAHHKQQVLTNTIDQQVAALDRARAERRRKNQGHEPERREGFDRRARVAPAAPDVKFDVKGTADGKQ